MRLFNFLIIRLTFYLIIGICFSHFLNISLKIAICITLFLIIILGVYWALLRFKINNTPFFGVLVYSCIIFIGITSYSIKNNRTNAHHFFNQKEDNNTQSLILEITEVLKPDTYNTKYIASLKSINDKKVEGKLLINLKKDSLFDKLKVDDVIYTSVVLKPIQKPLNPHQFNYSEYLKLKQIYCQIYIDNDEFYYISKSRNTIYGYAAEFREIINKNLISSGFNKNILSIINALLLGQRTDIDKTIYNNYVNSGTIHILAVSGLHVGIILLILNVLLKPLLYLKRGYLFRPFIIVIFLWLFAIVAGLSPSVTRAVTMFSIISIAMHLKRPTNIYNTLAISAFIILLVNPTFLFQVGFQMSYLAVLGIVSIQPILYRLWSSKYIVINKLWQIFTVTIAAQIGVLPISLFYFHQFPGLFFISNIVVIPFLGLILGFGILVIVWSLIGVIPNVLVEIYSTIINSLNTFIAWISGFENFLFKDISFSFFQVICSYIIIVFAVRVYVSKNTKWIPLCLVGVIGFLGVKVYNNFQNSNPSFVVFNKSRHTLIGKKQNGILSIHHNLNDIQFKADNVIKNYVVGESITKVKTDSLKTVYQFNSKTILVVDSFAVYEGLTFKPNYIILKNSPKINLNRLIDSINPEYIIADASNYKSYLYRWKATCEDKKIPFHQTNKKGAFVLK